MNSFPICPACNERVTKGGESVKDGAYHKHCFDICCADLVAHLDKHFRDPVNGFIEVSPGRWKKK